VIQGRLIYRKSKNHFHRLICCWPETPPVSICLDQRFGFGGESRSSRDVRQSGKNCAMECTTKADLCRRLSRRVNIIARKNPVKAPRNASVIERLLNGRSPWPVRMNPVYAIATVQTITRTENMEDHLLMRKCLSLWHLWRADSSLDHPLTEKNPEELFFGV
jgi:hypothetical protein